jgi:acyl carrier protein phosphodiesterase
MELDYKKIVLEYLNTSMEHDDFTKAEFKVYSETTADGYEVYVATLDDMNPSINEDVYYYDSDLAEAVMDALEDHYSVYIDSYLYDDIYLDDTFEEYFSENVEKIVSDSPDSFTEEELAFVKKEYLDEDEETEE